MTGAELAKTPLHDEHVALGARMEPFAGFEMPVEYVGVIEEHKAVREAAGVFDRCHLAEFRVFGFGAFEFLQGLLTNDLSLISELGTAQYTLLCDEDGGIIDVLTVYHSGDIEYLIVANTANRQADWDWLSARCPEDVELADESERTGLIALQGPRALKIVEELAEGGVEIPERFSISEAVLGSIPVLLSRTGYTGEDGVEILCFADHAPPLWRAILSFSEVMPCGLGACDTLRLEMGYVLHGSDIDRGVDPISAGLGGVVSVEKTGFIGAEAIARIRTQGPKRKLVGLGVDEGIPRPGYPVLHGGEAVGKVASGTYSPTLESGIATAYVPADLATPGQELEVEIRSNIARATVTKVPFVGTTSLKD
jgi:aminomethyltransferase